MLQVLKIIYRLIMLQQSGVEELDTFISYSAFALEIAAAIGMIVLLLRNEPLRKRTNPQNRLMFWECVLVLCMNLLNIIFVPLSIAMPDITWMIDLFFTLVTVNELLYLFIILQWLVCVDYSLNHSMDHIRRRYRKAALPIVIVTVLDIMQDLVFGSVLVPVEWRLTIDNILYAAKMIIEVGYILTAIYLVKKHEKENREPRFLRLSVFIVPFVIGTLFRYYDAPFIALAVILTYEVMKKRDRLIDPKTGFYNAQYLDHLCAWWDKKGYRDSNAIMISAPGSGDGLNDVLEQMRIPDCYTIAMGEGQYVLITGAVRGSAIKMTTQMLLEAAQGAEKPFALEITTKSCSGERTMTEFASEIRETFSAVSSPSKGGEQ